MLLFNREVKAKAVPGGTVDGAFPQGSISRLKNDFIEKARKKCSQAAPSMARSRGGLLWLKKYCLAENQGKSGAWRHAHGTFPQGPFICGLLEN